MFDRLQRIFRANEATSIRRGERYLLTGLLRCGICGGKMVGRPQHGRARYICIATGSVRLGVIADGLEACVVEAASPMKLTNAVELADLSTIAPELRAELATVEARVAEIADGLAEGKLSLAIASKAEDKLTAQLAELESAIAKAEEDARPKNPWLALQEELEQDWRAWLDTLIETITVAASTTGSKFDCSRVSITWKVGVTQK